MQSVHLDAGLILAILCSGALSAAGGPVLVSEVACSHMMCVCMLMYACEREGGVLPTLTNQPTNLPTYLSTYLPTTYLSTYLLPIYLLTYLSTYLLLTYLPAYLPT